MLVTGRALSVARRTQRSRRHPSARARVPRAARACRARASLSSVRSDRIARQAARCRHRVSQAHSASLSGCSHEMTVRHARLAHGAALADEYLARSEATSVFTTDRTQANLKLVRLLSPSSHTPRSIEAGQPDVGHQQCDGVLALSGVFDDARDGLNAEEAMRVPQEVLSRWAGGDFHV